MNTLNKYGRDAADAEAQAHEDKKNSLEVCKFHDPLIMIKDGNILQRKNPIADKFYILTREDSAAASQLKPTASEQEKIDEYVLLPDFQRLSEDEKGLIWRYRYSQKRNRKVLVKFLLSVNWN